MCCLALDNTSINYITNHINAVKILIEVVQCIWSYYIHVMFLWSPLHCVTVLCVCVWSFLNVDIQILQIQMCQKLQEEAKPKKNKMDQSIQKGIRKGTDSGEMMNYNSAIAEIELLWYCSSKNKLFFRTTHLNLRNAEMHLLNITGISGKRQVMCFK